MKHASASQRAFSLWDLRRYLKPHTKTIKLAAAAMLAQALVLVLFPWPLKFIIDSVLFQKHLPNWLIAYLPDPVNQRLELLTTLGLAMVALGVADAALSFVGNRLLQSVGQRAVFAVRCDLFSHIQRLSLAFHRRQRAGDLMARLGGDIQTLQNLVVSVGTGAFAHFVTLVGMAAIMLMIDWRFALVVIGIAPLLLLLTKRHTARLRTSLRLARKKEGELWAKVQELLANIHIVQAYGRERHEDARFAKQAEEGLDATIKATTMQGQLGPLVAFVLATATAAATWYGATRVLAGRITAGDLLVFLAYLRSMASPVRQSAKMAGVVSKGIIAVERLGEVLAEECDIRNPVKPKTMQSCRGDLSFRAVSFAYKDDAPLLEDISFHATPGQTIALVGPTGAGKTTLVSLVPRFHDPSAGNVLIDGEDLRSLPLEFVRSQVSLVLQEPLIFHGTIWENIAYGRLGAARSEAIAAARAVGIDDLITGTVQGYDTVVGERGATLSGGQRQCLSIARAMLRDSPIVILDEPTSGMDAQSEDRVLEALRRLTAGRTTLIIAHRLATVMSADLILVLEQGKIVERGTHESLLGQGRRYWQLWNFNSNLRVVPPRTTLVDGKSPVWRDSDQVSNSAFGD